MPPFDLPDVEDRVGVVGHEPHPLHHGLVAAVDRRAHDAPGRLSTRHRGVIRNHAPWTTTHHDGDHAPCADGGGKHVEHINFAVDHHLTQLPQPHTHTPPRFPPNTDREHGEHGDHTPHKHHEHKRQARRCMRGRVKTVSRTLSSTMCFHCASKSNPRAPFPRPSRVGTWTRWRQTGMLIISDGINAICVWAPPPLLHGGGG